MIIDVEISLQRSHFKNQHLVLFDEQPPDEITKYVL